VSGIVICLLRMRGLRTLEMPQIKALSETLRTVAAPGMTPKALRAAVREKHPDATKKDIVRAAFHALTEEHSKDLACLAELHGFALVERVSEDELTIKVDGRKKKRRLKPAAAAATASAPAAT
jgi:hypothetical protein